MSAMDEITYWIYTKRAPCLMSYDDDLLKKRQETESSESKLQTPLSISDDDPKNISPKKRKRKLSLLDEDSLSPKGPENVFFYSSNNRHQNQEKVLSSCKSSDVNFNIKKSSVKEKSKRRNLQKNGRTTLHKKSIIVSSTPKVNANLRRSLRNSRKSFNDSNQLNSSFEILNGINPKKISSTTINKQKVEKCKRLNKLSCGDETLNVRSGAALEMDIKRNFNGKFEDLSDVSGFTANYIRSTKLHSSRNGKRNKSNRSLLKESRQSLQKEQNKTVICINKSMNTGVGNLALNQSTDSSQNCLNLVTTVSSHQQPVRVSRSTSLLKFIDSKPKICRNDMNTSQESHLDISIHSPTNGNSRYPKRYKNNISQYKCEKSTPNHKLKSNKNAKVLNISSHIDESDRKENPGQSLPRTRSGRSLGFTNLTMQQSDTSILVISNETEPVSSAVTVNVAGPNTPISTPNNLLRNVKITALSSKSTRRRSSLNGRKSGQSTLREKSGFAACFSDSDEDKPLKSQKFFC